MSIEQESEEISDGRRVAEFFDDPVIKAALIRVEKQYFAEFKAAKTSLERDAIWAKTQALGDLFIDLVAVKDRGKMAEHTRQQREAGEEREKARRERRK